MLKFRLLISAAAFAVAAVPLFAPIAPPAEANHSWGGYHWARTSNPFTLQVGRNVNGTWSPYLTTTRDDWSRSGPSAGIDSSSVVLPTLVTGAAINGNLKTCKPPSGRVEVCNAAYGFNGWLGVAQIWLSGSHITAGSVKLNDTYFNTSTYNKPEWRNLVSCQEFGHTLGLDHQDENFSNPNLNTCMDYTSLPLSNQHPNQHDYDQLVTIYGHVDSTTTLALGTSSRPGRSGSAAADGPNNPDDFGRPVGPKDGYGRDIVFQHDLPDGSKRLTHVFWALPGSGPGAPAGR